MGIMASLLSTITVLYCHYKVFTCSNYKGSGERKQSNKLFLLYQGAEALALMTSFPTPMPLATSAYT